MPSWKKVIVSGSDASLNSVSVTTSVIAQSFTGSLFGTASWARNTLTASFITASNVFGPFGSNSILSASYAVSASNALTASYAENITISGSIRDVDYIDFDTSASYTLAEGRLGWDNGDGSLQLGMAGGAVQYAVGEQLLQYCYNAEAVTMTKGQVVYVSGSQGNRIAVKFANNSGDPSSAGTLGLVAETIAAGDEGWVITEGVLRKLNTIGLTLGATLYLGAAPGTYTQTAPTPPSHSVRLGYVERVSATVGSIYVKVDNGYELGELHDVLDTTTTASYGDLLVKSGSLWINSKQLTGSYGLTGSLTATSFTGSLQGTASWANNAITSSYILNAISASFASTASFVNPLNQTVVITGSINFADGAERQIIIPAGPNFTSGMVIGVSGSSSGNTTGGSLTLISGNSTGTGFAGNININGGVTPGSTATAVSGGNVALNGGAITGTVSGNGETAGSINLTGGNTARSGNTTGGNITLLGGSATTNGTGGSVIINPGSGATTGSIVLANLRGNVGIGTTTPTSKLTVSGSANISAAVTASTLLVSGSGTQRVTIIGSGSAQPIFTVQGSQGELFSITDSLSGSLFSVNDISGLPILEVFSDDTVLIGDYTAPSLNTTKRIASTTAGVNVIYSLPTSSYDGVFVDYTIRSGSLGRAGNFMAMWSGSTTDFTDNSINGFGNTAGFVFGASISGSNMIVSGSGTTAGWTVKAIIRSI